MVSEPMAFTANSPDFSSSSSSANTVALPNFLVAPVKLDRNNYNFWRLQILAAVKANGFDDFLFGSSPTPCQYLATEEGTQAMNPEYNLWIRRDQQLFGWMLASVTESMHGLISRCTNSAQLWAVLETAFRSDSRARVRALQAQLMSLKKGDLSITDYISKMQGIADNVQAAGKIVTDDDLITHILHGLGPDYEAIAVNLNTRADTLTLQEVQFALQTHEMRLLQSVATYGHTAHLSTKRQFNEGGGRRFEESCGRYRADEAGGAHRGRSSYKGRGRGRFIPKKPQCQICGKSNHIASKCFKRYDLSFAGIDLSSAQAHMVTASPTAPVMDLPQGYVAEGFADEQPWYLDSGATSHIATGMQNLSVQSVYNGSDKLSLGNGSTLSISHIGSTSLPVSSNRTLSLQNVLVPAITKNLLSISQFTKENHVFIEFHPRFCVVKDNISHQILLRGVLEDGLYKLEPVKSGFSTTTSSQSLFQASVLSVSDADLWHQRLGHSSLSVVQNVSKLVKKPFLSRSLNFCNACKIGKLQSTSFSSRQFTSSSPFQLVYSDLWGPASTSSSDGYKYYILFVDDFSSYTWLYPLTTKSEALSAVKHFTALVSTQHTSTIQSFQCDFGGEYRPVITYLHSLGVKIRHPCPYTHQQNGKPERKHQHIVDMGLTFLAHARLPYRFWWDSFVSAVYTINRLPTSLLNNKSPFATLYNKTPDYTFLKVFGCSCFPYLRPYNSSKLQYRSSKCLFLGYSPLHKGYRCLSSSGRIYISRTVSFNETEFPYQELFPDAPAQVSTNSSTLCLLPFLPPPHTCSTQPSTTPSCPQLSCDQPLPGTQRSPSLLPPTSPQLVSPLLSSSSPQQVSQPLPVNTSTHPMITRSKKGVFKPKTFSVTVQPSEPVCVKDALSHPFWKSAMNTEFSALLKNNTWELVPYTDDMKVVDHKWIFKIKYNKDGRVDRYKARLVAKGFQQVAGIDYFDTFSPVVKPVSVRLMFAMAVSRGWTVQHVDINNAFLHGDLTETVYMSQPVGFEDSSKPGHVCRLLKAIYGLKQAPKAWNDKLKTHLFSLGFHSSTSDTSLFFRRSNGKLLMVLVYVDDILLTGDDSCEISTLIANIADAFSLKHLGAVNFFLGIQVNKTGDGVVLSQTQYIKDLLQKTNLADCNPCSTPFFSNQKLSLSDGEPFQHPTLYRSTVGALQYVTLTRPDIAFIVNKLSQFLHLPTVTHWHACKKVLRFLKGTITQGLLFKPCSRMNLEGFADSDWASSVDDRKSTSGYCIYLGSNLVSWSSKKQSVVARSSAEAEYRALANATTELVWIKSLFDELGVKLEPRAVLWCDNISAIALASNSVFHARTKHIEVDVHFIREKVKKRELDVRFLTSEDQLADLFTKPLATKRFHQLCSKFFAPGSV